MGTRSVNIRSSFSTKLVLVETGIDQTIAICLIRFNAFSDRKKAKAAALVLVPGLQFAISVRCSAAGTGQDLFQTGINIPARTVKNVYPLEGVKGRRRDSAGHTEYSRTIFRHARRNSAAWAVNRKCKATLLILARTAPPYLTRTDEPWTSVQPPSTEQIRMR